MSVTRSTLHPLLLFTLHPVICSFAATSTQISYSTQSSKPHAMKQNSTYKFIRIPVRTLLINAWHTLLNPTLDYASNPHSLLLAAREVLFLTLMSLTVTILAKTTTVPNFSCYENNNTIVMNSSKVARAHTHTHTHSSSNSRLSFLHTNHCSRVSPRLITYRPNIQTEWIKPEKEA